MMKKCFIFTCHPSYMVCWWVLLHSGWDFTWKFIIKGHLHTENINLWCILDPRSLLVQVLNEMLTLVILNGSQKCGNRHPEGLNIYMGMGMFLCIIEESSSYSLWNQKKNWSLPNKGKIWVKICLLIFWMLIVSMPLFQTWESLERTSKRLI